jgi:hypothetical protein
MAGTPREWVYVVQESAYMTPVSSPAVWTTSSTYGLSHAAAYYVRLDGPNKFTMRARPTGAVTTPYGGGLDIPAYMVSDKQEVKGQLTLQLTVGQAPMWLSWALSRITGGTAPWTTSINNGDLASCSVYHATTRSDGSIKRSVSLGTKVDSLNLSVNEGSTIVTLQLNLSASTPQGNQFDSSSDPNATIFPAPADNNFPIDPYVFINAGGSSYFTYAGAVRTQFTELTLSVQNELARKYFANRYLQLLTFVGRKTTLATKLLYPAVGQDDRALFEGLTPGATSIEMNNGTHGFTIGLNAQNVLTPFEDDLPLNDVFMQSSTSNNMWDPTAGSDLTLTIT